MFKRSRKGSHEKPPSLFKSQEIVRFPWNKSDRVRLFGALFSRSIKEKSLMSTLRAALCVSLVPFKYPFLFDAHIWSSLFLLQQQRGDESCSSKSV